MPNLFRRTCLFPAFYLFAATQLPAQRRPLELGVTYTAQHSMQAHTEQSFWIQGGSIELGANVWKGLGIAVDVAGGHTNSVGGGGVPLSLVTTTFGPRYRWHADRKISLYGEALLGEANGFNSTFPSPTGAQSSANGLALQIGGGVDYRLSDHFAVRMLDAGWLHTQLPNGGDNVQNILRLGAGVVVRFGRQGNH